MKTLPKGFYTALGTPLDQRGNVLTGSLAAQVQQQCRAGAAGLLVLGSMGIQAYLKQDQAAIAVAAVSETLRNESNDAGKGQRPVFLAGVMDNSIERVLQRIELLRGFDLDGVVATTPFYGLCNDEALLNFFTRIADRSPYPLYLYDLPGVTKIKITLPLVRKIAEHPNVRGIKTGDMILARWLRLDESLRERFCPIFSGLDIFDVAAAAGFDHFLDGMFACCPRTTERTFRSFEQKQFEDGAKSLNQILDLRDTMLRFGIFPAFTIVMNQLGLPGSHAPDYEPEAIPEAHDVLRNKLIEMGELAGPR